MQKSIDILRSQPVYFLERRTSRRNARLILRLVFIFVFLVATSSIAFHYLMEMEGKKYSPFTGVYWTFETMTTLGLGDISFDSDLGKLFTITVLLSGIFFLLVVVPFTLYQLFQSTARVPRELSNETRGHIILTHFGPVSEALIQKLMHLQFPYALAVSDLNVAAQHLDHGIRAVYGDLHDPITYQKLRISHAALVAATASDASNTMVLHTIRQIATDVPILCTSTRDVSPDLLRMAGATQVLQLDDMMGQALARRTLGGDALAHPIGQFDNLTIAEAMLAATPLIGRTLAEAQIERLTGLHPIGIWDRSVFLTASPDVRITPHMVLILAGDEAGLAKYNELFCIYHVAHAPVLVIGAGNVGRATADGLSHREQDFRVIEKLPERMVDHPKYVYGDAADTKVLQQAGIDEAPAVVITSHDDESNVYLTTLLRYLRPDIQILSRATYEQTVHTLHQAGCDVVLSYASLGANLILSSLKKADILMVAEGVDVFKVRTPRHWTGKPIRQTTLLQELGCDVVGYSSNGFSTLLPPSGQLPRNSDVILIGPVQAENAFLRKYGKSLM